MQDWRPSSPASAAASRAAMLQRVRDYFATQQVMAVDTPALSAYATSDANINSVAAAVGAERVFLHTSPESSMKCLLAAGYPDIYSICRVFRDGETGRYHLPEFTLLEWYRLGFGLGEIVADTTALVANCLQQPGLGQDFLHYDYAELFESTLDLDVFEATIDELADTVSADAPLRATIGNDRDAWLDLALATKIVPAFPPDRLTVIRHYPASQGALARLCPDNSQCADRFEVFLGSLELANGYVELTDASEQRRRFERDNEQRRAAGLTEVSSDELLLAALQHGLPGCAGVAVGLERLQMIHDQVDHIAAVVTFANRRKLESS